MLADSCICFFLAVLNDFRINYRLEQRVYRAHRTKKDFIEKGRFFPFPRTVFQQQIKDFKPKVISSDGRSVTLWKRGDRESVFIVFGYNPSGTLISF